MGYSGKLEEKLKAQELRKNGFSYQEILQHITVSKDSLSRWCKEIELTEEQKRRLLKNKQLGQRKGSLVAAENKRNARLLLKNSIYSQAVQELGGLSKRELFLVGLALYAGEGYKEDGKIGFANADPALIVFMINWFTSCFNIPINKFRGSIWLHENLNEKQAKIFWSSLTGIPIQQFHKTYIVKNKLTSKKIRKNIHEFGIFTLKIFDSQIHRKIMGWNNAIFNGRISSKVNNPL